MASLFLAAKIEECNRRLRDILNVFHHLKQKRKRRYVSITTILERLAGPNGVS